MSLPVAGYGTTTCRQLVQTLVSITLFLNLAWAFFLADSQHARKLLLHIYWETFIYALHIRNTHSGIDQTTTRVCFQSLFGIISWKCQRKWYKGDPRLCSLCILYALNTVVAWHYLEDKNMYSMSQHQWCRVHLICPQAKGLWAYQKTWRHTLTQISEKFPMVVLHYCQWL